MTLKCPHCGKRIILTTTTAAAVMGAKGGKAGTLAQQAQRAKPKPGAGRPRKYCPDCRAVLTPAHRCP